MRHVTDMVHAWPSFVKDLPDAVQFRDEALKMFIIIINPSHIQAPFN